MPQNTKDIIRAINSQQEAVVSQMLWDLIDEHKRREGGHQRALHKRYEQGEDGVPIYAKKFENYEKVHERIPNDFFGDIVDLKTGYMGNEIIIDIDQRKVGKSESEAESEFLTDFATRNGTIDKNSELVKMAAITGKAYRLLFISPESSRASVENLKPWETTVFKDSGTQIPTYAMRYYLVSERSFDANAAPGKNRPVQAKEKMRVEWFDETSVTYYRENEDGTLVLDAAHERNPEPHLFAGVPIIEFKNNEEGLAEAQKSIDLIDAYDNLISDAISEVEQLRMAYMFAKGAGMEIDADFERLLQQTGIWPLPENGEIGFVGKNLSGASEFMQSILGEIRRNIYSFAKSLDLSQDKGGDMRVIGWQVNMLRLEMSAQVTERKFKRAYMRQYELLTNHWRSFDQADIDPMALRFVFTRKFPKDIDQEIDTLTKAMEVLPLENAYALMTFIDNPAELAEKYRKERPEMVGLLAALDDAELVARNINRDKIRENAEKESGVDEDAES